ncbi:hypothetical protein FSW04_08950 [Baekduia soli]|uniref:Uncharacterized protein n=1 Tax=Baekduia soli TaxID=496014 RepID=A0A5B8U3U0_9ACTN|nr:hypothetical protein [Baekduia soli]QEC47687.1 hypothetical protein FSW04_08950 [Baekduia soli]
MPRSRRAVLPRLLALGAGVAALTSAGCFNGPDPPDLFLVQRTGSIADARLTLRISDDGGAYCNGGPRREISSAQLIEARALTHDLDGVKDGDNGLAGRNLRLAPGKVSSLTYRVRSEKGVVVFSDTSARQPQAFYRIAQLTRSIAKGPCGLAR